MSAEPTVRYETCPRCGGNLIYSFPLTHRGGRLLIVTSRYVGNCLACGWEEEPEVQPEPAA